MRELRGRQACCRDSFNCLRRLHRRQVRSRDSFNRLHRLHRRQVQAYSRRQHRMRHLRGRQVLRSPRIDLRGFDIVHEVRSWIVFCICGGSDMYIVSGGEDKRDCRYSLRKVYAL